MSSPLHQDLPPSYHCGSLLISSQGLSFHIPDTYTSFSTTLLPPLPPRTNALSSFTHTPFPVGLFPPLAYSTMTYPSTPFPSGPSSPFTIQIIINPPSPFLSTLLVWNESYTIILNQSYYGYSCVQPHTTCSILVATYVSNSDYSVK